MRRLVRLDRNVHDLRGRFERRQLERELGTLLRKTATKLASGKVEAPVVIGLDEVRDALGLQD